MGCGNHPGHWLARHSPMQRFEVITLQYEIEIDLCRNYSELVQNWMKCYSVQSDKKEKGEDLRYEYFNVVIPLVQLSTSCCATRVLPNLRWALPTIKLCHLSLTDSFMCSDPLNPADCNAYPAE